MTYFGGLGGSIGRGGSGCPTSGSTSGSVSVFEGVSGFLLCDISAMETRI